MTPKERRQRGTQCTAALVAWLDEHGLAWIDNPNADQWGDKAQEARIGVALERSGIEEMDPRYPIDDLEEFMHSITFRSGRLRDAIYWDADLWIFKVKETGIADWNAAWRAALEDGIDTGSGDCLIPAYTTWRRPPAIPEFVGPDEPLNSYNRRARRMMEEQALRQKEQTRREIVKKQVYWSFVLHWLEGQRNTTPAAGVDSKPKGKPGRPRKSNVDRAAAKKALADHGNKSAAARALGINRKTLVDRLEPSREGVRKSK